MKFIIEINLTKEEWLTIKNISNDGFPFVSGLNQYYDGLSLNKCKYLILMILHNHPFLKNRLRIVSYKA